MPKRYTKLTDKEREEMIDIWRTLSPHESRAARCRQIGRKMRRAHSSIEKHIAIWQKTEEGMQIEKEIAEKWESVEPPIPEGEEAIIRLWRAQDPLLARETRIRRISWALGFAPSKVNPAVDRWLRATNHAAQ